jgi:DNA repair protein RecO (recombination protein O)
MMQKVEAIILRSINYQESSKILTLYTREYGALGVIAKGARRRHRTFGASLDLMAHIEAQLYIKESRELQLLSDADLIDEFPKIQADFEKLFLALSMLELTYIVTRHTERNDEMFDLLLNTLKTMESATNSVVPLFYYFEANIIELLGFRPSLGACEACGKSLRDIAGQEGARVAFEIDRGAFRCGECSPPADASLTVNAKTVALWEHFSRMNVKSITETPWEEALQGELDRVISNYLEYHQPEMRSLRAKRMYDSLQPDK